MGTIAKLVSIVILILLFVGITTCLDTPTDISGSVLTLPQPQDKSPMSVEEALSRRRSIRDFADKPVSLEDVSQILWAAQGITSERGFRTAPSAGALYPLEVYLVASNVDGLEAGLYRYQPSPHALEMLKSGDLKRDLANAALGQSAIVDGAINLVITAVYERTARKYGERAERYVHIEVGHVGQNVCMQVESLGLGTVTIGAFYDDKVKKALGIDEAPLYIMPIGKRGG